MNKNKVIGLVVLVIFLGLAGYIVGKSLSGFLSTSGIVGDNKKTPPKLKVNKEKDVKTLDSYERIYDTTFFYSGQRINVEKVQVTRLQEKRVVIRYRLNIVPAKNSISWINKSNFSFTRGNFRRQAKRVTVKKRGAIRKTTVTFTLPNSVVTNDKSYFAIRYPTHARSDLGKEVKLALKIPK